MTTDTNKPSKAPAEPKVKVVQVNPESFDLICKALYNQTTETLKMARDIAEIKLEIVQLAATLANMGTDLHSVAKAHQGLGFRQEKAPPVDLDTISKRLSA